MNEMIRFPLQLTDSAINRIKTLIAEEANPHLKFRVYITGGGCSGLQYGFTFDDKVNEEDIAIEKQGVVLIVDPISLQYLLGGLVDYSEGLKGSRFFIINPNVQTTCSCGSSFSMT